MQTRVVTLPPTTRVDVDARALSLIHISVDNWRPYLYFICDRDAGERAVGQSVVRARRLAIGVNVNTIYGASRTEKREHHLRALLMLATRGNHPTRMGAAIV